MITGLARILHTGGAMSVTRHLLIKCGVYVTTLVLLLAHSISPVSAQFDSFYLDNNIYFYDKSAQGPIDACSGTAVVGETNIHKIWNYLIEKGLSDVQAAGILGNIREESGYSATRQQDGMSFPSGGWGIVQWDSGSRRPEVVRALQEFDASLMMYYDAKYGGATSESDGYVHKDITDMAAADKLLGFQLDFMYDEAQLRMTHGFPQYRGMSEWQAISRATTIREASDIWLVSYERPANQSESHKQTRAKHGEDVYSMIMANRGSLTSGGSCVGGSASALQSLTLEYAHPEYHRAPYRTKRPAYEDAVQKAMNSGGYVGSTAYPGVDCGGFVTLLVINSGFDPTYNHNGNIADGAGYTAIQEQWLQENWNILNPGDETIDTAILQPGDVAMIPGHSWIYVGNIDGFSSDAASASLDERAPMAAAESADYLSRAGVKHQVKWYRR